MIDQRTLLTIILMAVVTYLTRVIGYMALKNRSLSIRAQAILEAVPGCVLISVIAPAFFSTDPANLIALTITLLTAMRYSILPTVLISIATTGLLRHLVE
jgi:uncharacterized membrane protein